MFQDLYRFLRTGGLKVYSLGQQDKICTEPYVLIYEAGTEDTSSSKNLKKESIEPVSYTHLTLPTSDLV